jgi:hypothetical protein
MAKKSKLLGQKSKFFGKKFEIVSQKSKFFWPKIRNCLAKSRNFLALFFLPHTVCWEQKCGHLNFCTHNQLSVPRTLYPPHITYWHFFYQAQSVLGTEMWPPQIFAHTTLKTRDVQSGPDQAVTENFYTLSN